MGSTVLDSIREALDAAGASRPVAVGWATVELDRAAAELAGSLGLTPDAFVPEHDSVVLGARCRVAPGVLPDGLSLAILEPIAEGRLAGRLARLGEGPAAVWAPPEPGVTADGSGGRPGPFGPERLAPGGPVQGPYRLLIVDAPGTIPP
jgi:hypothetical protein